MSQTHLHTVAMIRERVVAGMARAAREGKHCGRPRVDAEREATFLEALGGGATRREARRRAGIGGSAADRLYRSVAAPSQGVIS